MGMMNAIKEKNYFHLARLVFVGITIAAIFIPLQPDMPESGLDPSWKFALNYAKAAGLNFGTDTMFTFGPYASLFTNEYHPNTDQLMILGSCFLATFYLIALCQIGPEISIFRFAAFMYVAVSFLYLKDNLLASYPLLLSIVFFRYVTNNRTNTSIRSDALLGLLVAPLGLLPLIKGSLLLMPLVFVPLYYGFLWIANKRWGAIVSLLSPIITMIAAWIIAGQSLTALPGYLRSMVEFISGYTDAMSTSGDVMQMVAFLIAASGIFLFLIRESNLIFLDRMFLIASVGVFLFVSFKGGFVRHDGHALMAGNGILVATALIGLTGLGSYFFPLLCIVAAASTFFIDYRILQSTSGIIYENITRPYQRLISGLEIRAHRRNILKEEYNTHINAIHSELAISPLSGTSDIYAYNQSYLLASKNVWSPRPVLQSYAAFTPWLIDKDSEHLLQTPPDNIVFRVETIDNRIPSLDDGLSWPTILSSYAPNKFENNYIYLKRSNKVTPPPFTAIQHGIHSIGETVVLPNSDKVLFAKLSIKKTLVGKIISFLYKSSQLNVTFVLSNGAEKTFRIIPGMAETGFVISPLAESTAEFSLLYGDRASLEEKEVESIRVQNTGWGNYFWKSAYGLEIETIDMTRAASQTQVAPFAPLKFGLPDGVTRGPDENCQSAIDTINGAPPTPNAPIFNLLTLSGWMTVPEDHEDSPQQVFVTATDESGTKAYITTNVTPRPDVKNYFHRPSIPEPGFETSADLRDLKGNLAFGLARVRDGQLHDCNNASITLARPGQPEDGQVALKNIKIENEKSNRACEGNIDELNGGQPSITQNVARKSLSISGWTTTSGKDGLTPELKFITVTASDGKKLYSNAQSVARPDIASHFGHQELIQSGFRATISISKLSGNFRVGVSRFANGTLEACENLSLPISISP